MSSEACFESLWIVSGNAVDATASSWRGHCHNVLSCANLSTTQCRMHKRHCHGLILDHPCHHLLIIHVGRKDESSSSIFLVSFKKRHQHEESAAQAAEAGITSAFSRALRNDSLLKSRVSIAGAALPSLHALPSVGDSFGAILNAILGHEGAWRSEEDANSQCNVSLVNRYRSLLRSNSWQISSRRDAAWAAAALVESSDAV